MALENPVIAVIGLGYVGLPLAVEFGKKYSTIGYDLKPGIIESYKKNIDPSGELEDYFNDFSILYYYEGVEPDMSHGQPHQHGWACLLAQKV